MDTRSEGSATVSHVLLVEDNDGDARLVQESLAHAGGFRVTRASSLAEAVERLARESFDVVVLDLMLPDSQGIDSFSALQLYSPTAAVVILSGLEDREIALSAVQAGAQDFLPKSEVLSPSTPRALRYAVERHRLRTDLRRACLAAEAASDAKSAFLTRMSHELRTPLNGIIGNADLALDLETSPGVRECLGTIRRCGGELLALVEDVLDFARLETRRVSLEPAPVRLRSWLGDRLHAMAQAAWVKGLELLCRVDDDTPEMIIADEQRLGQVLANLVDNAIKFTDSGEVFVEVRCDRRSDDEAFLHFAVTDTGVGIPQAQREVMFEAFVQGDESTTRRHGGSGLGLSVASRLAEMMGGRVWVACDSHTGSQFHFTARVGIGERIAEARPLPADLTVLLVDDNRRSREIVRHMLRRFGARVVEAERASAAMRCIERDGPFHAVLVDSRMPGPSGWALARRLLATDACPPLVMMLADRPRKRVRDLARRGGVALLRKPVTEPELCAALLHALSRTASSSRGGASGPSSRVLIVEDNAVNQILTAQMLERGGHATGVASNGREALRMVEQEPWDLVLMDLEMPEMDGLEATRAIRARERGSGRRTPIVALTAHAQPGHREACVAAGMDDFLAKPVTMNHLLSVVGRFGPAPHSVQAPCSPAEVLDEGTLMSQLDGDSDLLMRLVRMFADSAPKNMERLRQAIDLGDAPTAARVAHDLGGSIASFHARPALEAARRVESLARQGGVDRLGAAYEELDAHLARLQEALPMLMVAGI